MSMGLLDADGEIVTLRARRAIPVLDELMAKEYIGEHVVDDQLQHKHISFIDPQRNIHIIF